MAFEISESNKYVTIKSKRYSYIEEYGKKDQSLEMN
ncbi:MAG: hypothetical protein QG670_688 [Thermoproteota archaeon]|nr:hypothetical protein [Thermoproteota archaeon]